MTLEQVFEKARALSEQMRTVLLAVVPYLSVGFCQSRRLEWQMRVDGTLPTRGGRVKCPSLALEGLVCEKGLLILIDFHEEQYMSTSEVAKRLQIVHNTCKTNVLPLLTAYRLKKKLVKALYGIEIIKI